MPPAPAGVPAAAPPPPAAGRAPRSRGRSLLVDDLVLALLDDLVAGVGARLAVASACRRLRLLRGLGVEHLGKLVRGLLERFKPQLCLLEGKKVWEVFPCSIEGKGPAVRRVLKAQPQSTLPIFVGDDVTDETAFAALSNGITVHVGNKRRTLARFYLRNPREVRTFLQRLEAEVT